MKRRPHFGPRLHSAVQRPIIRGFFFFSIHVYIQNPIIICYIIRK